MTPTGSGGSERLGGGDPAGNGGANLAAPKPLDARLPDETFSSAPRARGIHAGVSQSTRRSEGQRRNTYNPRRGRYVRAAYDKTDGARLALDATLRATLSVGDGGRGLGDGFAPVPHLRYKRFKRKAGALFVFAIDTSGSMALNRIAQAKGALLRLLQRSYIRRDRVALVTFRGEGAEQLLQPSGSMTRARRLLDSLGVGGATPLGAGLAAALEVVTRARKQGAQQVSLLLFTDGRANVPLTSNGSNNQTARRLLIEEELVRLGEAIRKACAETVVVDTQNRFISGGEGQRLADLTGARYVQLQGAVEELL